MFKAVLFDLDQTLIDFMKMKELSCDSALNAMIDAGLPLEKEPARKILFELYDEHGIENQKIFQKFLMKTMKSVDYRILSKGIIAYRKVREGFLIPYPKVKPTLIKLKEKGLRLGIVSDAPRLQVWMRLVQMGLDDFFDVVVTLEDTGKLKPSRLPFAKAIKELGVLPEEVLFVGDNPQRDIIGGKIAGMKTALAKYGQKFHSQKIKADYELNEFSDLLKIFE